MGPNVCDSVMQVDKILGSGNQYVRAAKMVLQNCEAMVAIGMARFPLEAVGKDVTNVWGLVVQLSTILVPGKHYMTAVKMVLLCRWT